MKEWRRRAEDWSTVRQADSEATCCLTPSSSDNPVCRSTRINSIKLVHFTLLIIRQLNLNPSNLPNDHPVSSLLTLSETLERAINSAKFLSNLSAVHPLILLLCHSLDRNPFSCNSALQRGFLCVNTTWQLSVLNQSLYSVTERRNVYNKGFNHEWTPRRDKSLRICCKYHEN